MTLSSFCERKRDGLLSRQSAAGIALVDELRIAKRGAGMRDGIFVRAR